MRRIAYTLVALFGATLVLGTPVMSAGNLGSGSVSAGIRVAISVKGRGVAGDGKGTFTLSGAAFDSGTSHLIANTARASRAVGLQLVPGRSNGFGELHGKNGDLSFDLSGSFFTVTASAVFTNVTSGVWRITKGTGVYKTWKGSGRFVSVDRNTPAPNNRTPSGVGSHEARWEGLVTR